MVKEISGENDSCPKCIQVDRSIKSGGSKKSEEGTWSKTVGVSEKYDKSVTLSLSICSLTCACVNIFQSV